MTAVFEPTRAICDGILQYLPAEQAGTTASSKIPPNITGKHIRITRIGGDDLYEVTDTVRVLVECWATTEFDAGILAIDVRKLINRGLAGRWITTIDRNKQPLQVFVRRTKTESAPVNFKDDSIKLERYQFQAAIDLKLN